MFYNYSNSTLTKQDILSFTQQMNILINAGISISDAMQIIISQTKHNTLNLIYSDIKQRLLDGSLLSDALEKYSNSFGKVYINIIKAGEISGSIDKSFNRLNKFLVQKNDLRNKINEALIYPTIIISISFLIIYLILVYFIPQIVNIFVEHNLEKTWNLELIIYISYYLTNKKILIFLSIVITYLIIKCYSLTSSGRHNIDLISIKIPILKDLVYLVNSSEFLMTLATLLTGGIPLSKSLDISERAIQNTLIKSDIQQMCISIKNGSNISQAMSELSVPIFSDMVIQMILVGEKTGDLEKSLNIAFEFVNEDIKHKTQIFIKLLGPLLIIFMGCIIGLIMLTTIIPLFEMYTLII